MNATPHEVADGIRTKLAAQVSQLLPLVGKIPQEQAVEFPRCETCRHWERSSKNPRPERALCLAKKLDSFSDPDGAYIPGARSAMFLSTGPRFGCVQHAPIDGTPK